MKGTKFGKSGGGKMGMKTKLISSTSNVEMLGKKSGMKKSK